MTRAAAPRAKISRGGLEWALRGIVVDHLTVSRVAAGLGVSWSAANAAVLAEGKRRLIDDPARFDGVTTIGVDEHVWRHTRLGDKYVTVIIDLTPVRAGTGPARLLDMVEGRSKQAFKTWLADRPQDWRDGVEVVGAHVLGGLRAEHAGGELREARRRVAELHRWEQVGEARLHGHGARVAAQRVLLPVRELVRHLLVGAVLQEASEEEVAGLEQLVETHQTPVYVVHFSQAAALERAQALAMLAQANQVPQNVMSLLR